MVVILTRSSCLASWIVCANRTETERSGKQNDPNIVSGHTFSQPHTCPPPPWRHGAQKMSARSTHPPTVANMADNPSDDRNTLAGSDEQTLRSQSHRPGPTEHVVIDKIACTSSAANYLCK